MFEHQVCGGGGRSSRKNLPAHLVYDRRIPQRVHSHRVRQLQLPSHCGRPNHQPQPVGHSRPGGVRPSSHAVLPPDQRLHHLLLHLQPPVLRERQAQVAPRGDAPLSQRAHPAGGDQERSSQRRGCAEEA